MMNEIQIGSNYAVVTTDASGNMVVELWSKTCLELSYVYNRGLCTPEHSERGNLVKSVIGEVTSYYVGSYYEKKVRGSEQNERKTYFAGTTRIAIPQGSAVQEI